MKSNTHSFWSLVQFPIQSGIFPDKLFPSILLQMVHAVQKMLNLHKRINVQIITPLTNQLGSWDCENFLVLFLWNCLQKEHCRSTKRKKQMNSLEIVIRQQNQNRWSMQSLLLKTLRKNNSPTMLITLQNKVTSQMMNFGIKNTMCKYPAD